MSIEPRRPTEAAGPLTPERIRRALEEVIDPEVGLDIVTLGLVYDVDVEGRDVTVTYTLTTPGCPLQSVLSEAVETAAGRVPGVDRVNANLVWDPPWNPGMIEEGAWRR